MPNLPTTSNHARKGSKFVQAGRLKASQNGLKTCKSHRFAGFLFFIISENPINIKEDVSNCVSDFSYLNSLTNFDVYNLLLSTYVICFDIF